MFGSIGTPSLTSPTAKLTEDPDTTGVATNSGALGSRGVVKRPSGTHDFSEEHASGIGVRPGAVVGTTSGVAVGVEVGVDVGVGVAVGVSVGVGVLVGVAVGSTHESTVTGVFLFA